MDKKRKWMKWISLLIIIILLFIYFKDYHGYRYLNKEIVFDDIEADVKIKYKNINENLQFILKPISKYSCEVNMEIDINGNIYENDISEPGYEDQIVIDDVHIVKDYENDDFKNYAIVYEFTELGKPKDYRVIIFYCVLSGEGEGYYYYGWDTLSDLLIEKGYDKYTLDEMTRIKEEEVVPWLTIKSQLDKEE